MVVVTRKMDNRVWIEIDCWNSKLAWFSTNSEMVDSSKNAKGPKNCDGKLILIYNI